MAVAASRGNNSLLTQSGARRAAWAADTRQFEFEFDFELKVEFEFEPALDSEFRFVPAF